MHHRGCGEQAVDHGKRVRHVQPAPFLGHRFIDRQDAVPMRFDNVVQPPIERCGVPPITKPNALDPLSDLAYREDAQIDVLLRQPGEPVGPRRSARPPFRSSETTLASIR